MIGCIKGRGACEMILRFAACFPNSGAFLWLVFQPTSPTGALATFFSNCRFLLGFPMNFTARAICISIRIFSRLNSVNICIAALFTGVLCFLRGHFELICVSFFVCLCFFEELLQAVAIPDRFLGKPSISDGFLKMPLISNSVSWNSHFAASGRRRA